jgi:hypothetical protein
MKYRQINFSIEQIGTGQFRWVVGANTDADFKQIRSGIESTWNDALPAAESAIDQIFLEEKSN